MSEVSLKVEIASSVYTLKVRQDEEPGVRKAVELINQKIADIEKTYAVKDKKDVLAMVTLQLVTQLNKQVTNDEHELSILKQVFADVEQMLIQHRSNARDAE